MDAITQDQVIDAVNRSADPKTFNLLDFARQRPLVRETVQVYFNEDAMHRLGILLENVDVLAEDFEPSEEVEQVTQELRESTVTLHLTAMDPVANELLINKANEENWAEEDLFYERLRHMLTSSEDAHGNVSVSNLTDRESAKEFFIRLPEGQRQALLHKMALMEVTATVLAQNIGPDFLSRA